MAGLIVRIFLVATLNGITLINPSKTPVMIAATMTHFLWLRVRPRLPARLMHNSTRTSVTYHSRMWRSREGMVTNYTVFSGERQRNSADCLYTPSAEAPSPETRPSDYRTRIFPLSAQTRTRSDPDLSPRNRSRPQVYAGSASPPMPDTRVYAEASSSSGLNTRKRMPDSSSMDIASSSG